jgi:hypothetical protein
MSNTSGRSIPGAKWKERSILAILPILLSFALISPLVATQRMVLSEDYTNSG